MKNNLILVVEDDIVSCELFRELFEKENIKPFLIVNDGEKAIEICKSDKDVQLVLMDYKLPGIDGCEALREIRKIRKNLPVVVQTACVFNGDKDLYLSCGFDDYLSKPIIANELISIIKKYCRYNLN
ncbi:MAG: response regulator [Bacteroidales bacterium]|nr:response regulator [Bacteroidales bacterium]